MGICNHAKLEIKDARTKRVEMTQNPRHEATFREDVGFLEDFLGRLKPNFLWVFPEEIIIQGCPLMNNFLISNPLAW